MKQISQELTKTTDVWRVVAVALISVVASLAASWFTLGQKAVTRDQVDTMIARAVENQLTADQVRQIVRENVLSSEDVRKMINNESPYTKDQSRINQYLNTYETTVTALRLDIESLKLAQAKIDVKLDLILGSMGLQRALRNHPVAGVDATPE